MKTISFNCILQRVDRYIAGFALALLLQPWLLFGGSPAPNGFFIDAQPVAGLEGPYVDNQADISPDQLTIYFTSRDRPGVQGGSDIYQATRALPGDPFNAPTRLDSPVNSAYRDASSNLSPDGLTLYFASDRPGGNGDYDIYQATRLSPDLPFSNALNLGAGVNGGASDYSPSVSSNGLTIYFASHREGFANLYSAARNSVEESFGNASKLGIPVNTDSFEFDVALAPDGLHLLFSRWSSGRAYDLHLASRFNILGGFYQEVDLNALSTSTINTTCFENGATLSWDWPAQGSKMYFQKDCTGDFSDIDIWEATWVTIATLSITRSQSNVTLMWPDLTDPVFGVEEATEIQPTHWTPTAGATNFLTVPISSEAKFFRLRRVR